MKIVVGSTALKKWYPDTIAHDLDVWTDDPADITSGTDSKVMPSHIMEKLAALSYQIDGVWYAVPAALRAIKYSHSIYDIHWCKTRDHILTKMRHVPVALGFFKVLSDYWQEVKPERHNLNFNASASEFFDDKVPRKIPHEMLHRIINPEPIYHKFLADGTEVDICETKFNQATIPERFQLFDEEIKVLMNERFLMVDNCTMHWYEAYQRALHMLVTRLTKPWQAYWIMEHIHVFVWLKSVRKYFHTSYPIVSNKSNGFIREIVTNEDGRYFKTLTSPDGTMEIDRSRHEVQPATKVVTVYE